MGHAARMIPLAKKLLERHHNVIIGSGEDHLSLFRIELPGLSYIHFPGFKPGYSRYLPQYIILLFKTPILFYHIIHEHFKLKRIIRRYSIDVVISDNRFGLWNRNIRSVYVTHMPLIPFPKPLRFLEFIGILLHRFIINKYSLCFIPDLPGELNVSGRLSHGLKLPSNVRYIGILSRFDSSGSFPVRNHLTDQHITVILSGPEPQREILKQKLVSILGKNKQTTIILEGRPGKTNNGVRSDNITFINHLPSSEMQKIISVSKSIVTRAGYSTIMELISLNCSALLIPTPGQTEQEYLAELLAEKNWFSYCPQNKIKEVIPFPPNKANWSDEILIQSRLLLEEALQELIE